MDEFMEELKELIGKLEESYKKAEAMYEERKNNYAVGDELRFLKNFWPYFGDTGYLLEKIKDLIKEKDPSFDESHP